MSIKDETVFSDHVRELHQGTFENEQAILKHLHAVVRRRLKAIGQWNLPPKYLGYDGESWEQSGAMDDLVQDAYLACVLKRLPKLTEQVEKTGTCEGSVHWKLKWFLSDRQERGNPIARRVFRNVRCASESLIESGLADCSCSVRLTSKSIVLAVGQDAAETADDLEDYFAGNLGETDFVKTIHRESPGSWETIADAIAKCFEAGMSGYKIGDLAKLLGDACKRPGMVSADDATSGSDGEKSILAFLEETRTAENERRYLANEAIEPWIASLSQYVKVNIRNARIQKRVLKTLAAVAELIRDGHEVREMSLRKLAERLGTSKSTLAEDFARLPTYDQMQEASGNDSES